MSDKNRHRSQYRRRESPPLTGVFTLFVPKKMNIKLLNYNSFSSLIGNAPPPFSNGFSHKFVNRTAVIGDNFRPVPPVHLGEIDTPEKEAGNEVNNPCFD